MIKVVGIRFQQDGKMLYYDAGELEPHMGDFVVAETGHGNDLGEVILGLNEMEEEQVKSALPKVIRIATQRDIQQATDNRAKERDAYVVCQRKIAEHKLEMKLVSVESTFDNSKLLFYFTANGRVDFRALVKDLASTFKTRIELRQIGVRDEARMLGGLGPCGRPICCGAFLNDFQPVSIKMAKEQNLSLNPTKISGVCGRLMCCLKYEQDQYEATRKKMPRIGREVITPDGSGIVSDLNVVKETVSVRIPTGDTTEIRVYPLEQITRPGAQHSNPSVQTAEEAPEESDSAEEMIPAELSEDEALDISAEPEAEPAGSKRPRKPKNENTGGRRFGPGNNRRAENEDSAGKADQQASGKANHRRKGPRDQKFGQPVRRENPDRDKKQPANAENSAAVRPEKRSEGKGQQPDKQVQASAEKPSRNAWAAAVDQALQSVEG